MSQRISITEELSESIRRLQVSVEQAWVDGTISDTEKLTLRREFVETKRQVRLVNLLQSAGLRLIRTGSIDKNLRTDFRAIEAEGVQQGHDKGRLLQFSEAPATRRRKASGGSDPLDAA